MKTRSVTAYENSNPPYSVNIDFDESSAAWKQNKKKQANGMYSYICVGLNKQGNPCKRKPLDNCEFCRLHKKLEQL